MEGGASSLLDLKFVLEGKDNLLLEQYRSREGNVDDVAIEACHDRASKDRRRDKDRLKRQRINNTK